MTKFIESNYFSLNNKYIYFWLFYLSYYFESAYLLSTEEIESHLEMGRQLIARRQYAEALSHLHAAVEGDSKNYLTYFKRATVYLALGRPKMAVDDLNEVLALKPDFVHARLQRGSILFKQGALDEAHIDLEWVLRYDTHNEEAIALYSLIETVKHELLNVNDYMEEGEWLTAIEILTKLLHDLPWDVKLLEMRSKCFEHVGDLVNAINDLTTATKLQQDVAKQLKISLLHYNIGHPEESLNAIRACLKLDPDHKECFKHYQTVKKVSKRFVNVHKMIEERQFKDCIENAQEGLKIKLLPAHIEQIFKSRHCHCLSEDNQSEEAIKVCTEALKLDNHDVDVLCDRAEAHIQLENFDDAKNDYQAARNIDEHSKRAADGLKQVQTLIAQRGKRDYYKILGIKRTATEKEIVKAYRKLAKKWHPDNFQDEEKKVAEKKFIDIAAAKEVLTDPEKRQRFDQGEDPLDAEAQAQRNNPFAGFHPFSDGPFQFKFHFN